MGTPWGHSLSLSCLLYKHELNVEVTMELQILDCWESLKGARKDSKGMDKRQESGRTLSPMVWDVHMEQGLYQVTPRVESMSPSSPPRGLWLIICSGIGFILLPALS